MNLQDLVSAQRQYFASGRTRPTAWRKQQLRRLRRGIVDTEPQLLDALHADLRKPRQEAYASELGMVMAEIAHAVRHLDRWARPRPRRLPWLAWPGRAHVVPQPLGVCCIIAPWNCPVLLLLSPLVGAMAAGNCAVVKASEFAPATAQCLTDLINRVFPRQYIHVVQGDAEVSRRLLQQRTDSIFFTGGTAIGREVMAAAATHLTPVTLELGGKCPCVVCDDAALDLTARRIAWGKFLNAGQTCLAPDYVLAHASIINALIEALRRAIDRFYGPDARSSDDYGRIVNHRHFERLAEMLKTGRTVVGGQADARDLYIAPTVVTDVPMDGPLMQDEIFGPILPVLAFSNLDEALSIIHDRASPLAVYLFTHDRATQNELIKQTRSGSVCVNDTVVQATGCDLPFGGVGDSGMGRYHGKASFDCFSYPRTILRRRTWVDPCGRYPPARTPFKRFRTLYNLFSRI